MHEHLPCPGLELASLNSDVQRLSQGIAMAFLGYHVHESKLATHPNFLLEYNSFVYEII